MNCFYYFVDPPDTPAIDGPLKALKDSTFDVTCSADSNPSPIYWWTYEDTPEAAVIGRGERERERENIV